MAPFLLYNLVLLLSAIHFGLSDDIYISPSQHDCKVKYKVCLTLNHLANNAVSINDNTTLIFLPGNHTLKYNLSISDFVNLSMQVDSSLIQGESTDGSKNSMPKESKFQICEHLVLKN